MPTEAIEVMLRNIAACDEALAAQQRTVALFVEKGFADLADKAMATIRIMERVQQDNHRSLAELEAKAAYDHPVGSDRR